MAETTPTAFRFTPDDLALLGAVQHHMGIRSRTEALRALIRYYARSENLVAPKRSAKRKP